MLVFFAGIMIFTTAFGRLWCGWTCPQTVMMEMVFRKIEYAIDRYAMETKRQMDVLNQLLRERRYICGDDYTIADIANWAWYGQLVLGRQYDAGEFLQLADPRKRVRQACARNANADENSQGQAFADDEQTEAVLRQPDPRGA